MINKFTLVVHHIKDLVVHFLYDKKWNMHTIQRRNQNQHISTDLLKKKKNSTTKTKKETKVPMPRTINAKTQ